MDPLSILASSIAIVQGVDRLASLLSKVLRLKEAPVEISHLIAEISQAKSTLSSVQSILLTFGQQGDTLHDLTTLDQILHQYAALIRSVELLIAKYLVGSGEASNADENGQPAISVSRWGWATKKSNVTSLRQKLEGARQLILMEMTVLSSSLQLQMQNSFKERLDQQDTILDRILAAQVEAPNTNPTAVAGVLTAQSTAGQTWTRPPQTGIAMRSPCKNCLCQCHLMTRLNVSWGRNIAGAICLGTTGSPFSRAGCNLDTCKFPSDATARGSFYTPHWIASRVVLFTLINGSSPSVSLNLARVVSPDTDFFRYIQMGRCDKVHELLEARRASPGDMVELSYGTLSALFFALNNGQVQVCKMLLSWGADPDLEHATSLTSSATDMAWNMSHEGGSSHMVDREDRLENIFPFPRDFDRRGFSRLTRILLGISGYDLDMALNVATAADFADVDCHGRTVTHWAAWNGSALKLRKILSAGADPDVADPAGRVPLHFSSMTRTAGCTGVLAEMGADVSRPDNFGETPLHCACSSGREVNVSCLLSAGADADAASCKGTTPLMAAVMSGSLAVVEMLLLHGVDLNAVDEAGETAVLLAVWMNRPDILQALSSTGRARLDVATFSGRTILHTAAQHGDVRMARALLGMPLGLSDPAVLNHEGLTAGEKLRQRTDLTEELVEIFRLIL